jgi:serine phosphatase RsbU (regulator of sigma subunit)
MSLPYLKWSSPTGQEHICTLSEEEVVIGRLSDSEIVLTNPYVSRQHAKVHERDGDFVVVDLNSTHGTFVNGHKISEKVLSNGDRITLGREQVDLLFVTEAAEAEDLESTLGDADLDKSMMQLTSVIPLADTESSNLEKISHILDFQYNWGKSFSAEKTFRQILQAALKLSGAERGYIMLKEETGLKYVVGLDGLGRLLSESEFQKSESIVQEVVKGRQPVLMTENIDQAFAQQQSILAMHLRAVACMPLKWISELSDEAETRGILYLDSTKTMHALTGLDQKILNKLAVEAANVFEKLEMIEAFEEKKALEKELALAQETQAALLPLQLPDVEGFELAAFSHPTRHVGGDFYDFLGRETSEVAGVLADVSGKGISAALLSSLLQGALQMECRSGATLSESLNLVNLYLCEKSHSNRFVTLFLFNLQVDGTGEYLSAGHNPAYLYRASNQKIEELPARDLVLGAFEFAKYNSVPLTMEPGDLLFIYSDGITEAMNPDDEMYGEERLTKLIRETASLGCKVLEGQLLDSIQQFTEGMAQTDDMTYMIVQKR